jgi:rare lipoprotein A
MSFKLHCPALPRRLVRLCLAGAGLVCAGLEPASARPPPHAGRGAAHTQAGKASFYSHRAIGKKTASGAKLSATGLTAASRTLPLGTKAKVTNTDTGRSVPVTVTDRGPYVGGRILDVSPKAATLLHMKEDGVSTVKVEPTHVPAKPGGH